MTDVCRRLESGQRELARIRVRTGALLLVLGLFLGVAYEILYFYVEIRQLHSHRALSPFWWSPWAYLYSGFAALLYHSRLIVVSLAPVAQNLCIMRAAIAIDAAVILVGYWIYLFFLPVSFMGMQTVVVVRATIDTTFALCALWIGCGTDVPRMRIQIWRLLGAWVSICTVVMVCLATVLSHKNRKLSVKWMWVPVQLATLVFIARPTWQRKLRRALTVSLEARSSRQAAAGVAALVGNCRPRDVLAQAAARFRCLHLDSLEFQDMADNSPRPGLLSRTQLCPLQRCDAFVSHSWHDDPDAKWDALQRWRGAFVKAKGREPSVWIDKCCVDQRNIKHDLRCLPVWLSGCKNFVVFCGPTYLHRLWCVVELFTFVHMGGRIEDITFVLVCRPGHKKEDLASIRASFATFSVSRCACFLPEDKARMLEVIAEAFGNLEHFNQAVRDIFDRTAPRGVAPPRAPIACCGDQSDVVGESDTSSGSDESQGSDGDLEDLESGRRLGTPSCGTGGLGDGAAGPTGASSP